MISGETGDILFISRVYYMNNHD